MASESAGVEGRNCEIMISMRPYQRIVLTKELERPA